MWLAICVGLGKRKHLYSCLSAVVGHRSNRYAVPRNQTRSAAERICEVLLVPGPGLCDRFYFDPSHFARWLYGPCSPSRPPLVPIATERPHTASDRVPDRATDSPTHLDRNWTDRQFRCALLCPRRLSSLAPLSKR